MNKDIIQNKLVETFNLEADEHLRSMVDGLLQLENTTDTNHSKNIIETLHREAHSLKGAARTVNFLDIEKICHSLEKIFFSWKKQSLIPNQEQFDTLHKILNSLLKSFQLDNESVTMFLLTLNGILDIHHSLEIKNPAVSSSSFHDFYLPPIKTVRISNHKLDSLLLKSEEMLAVKQVMNKFVNDLSNMNDVVKKIKSEWSKTLKGKSNQSSEEIIASGIERIKQLDSNLNELRSQLDYQSRHFAMLIESLLEDAKDLVMLPFSTLLDSLPNMVRNIAREQGKEINLFLSGTDIEIDKRILDEIKDPIIHIIRNCIDHGIEIPKKRNHKDPKGSLKIRITQNNANEVEITISDDGCGIDIDAVKHAAIKQELMTQQSCNMLSDNKALELIFLSGLSTSPVITNVSGQGLGMCIVKEKIEKIGGYIKLKSEQNSGTELTMILPLSLTTFKGILINMCKQTFVLPTANLERIIRIRFEDISSIEGKDTIVVDGESVSLVRLSDLLQLAVESENKENNEYLPVAIIHSATTRAAFLIDEVLGEQEILVKKLNKPIIRIKYISAVTILENGVPIPILNTNDLIKSILTDFPRQRVKISEIPEKISQRKTILVVEDSITTRMLFKNILDMAGYSVITAVDGADALTLLKEQEISLVVSDIEMPRMNGFELTKLIRSDKKLNKIPVILITTKDSQEDREFGIESGANAYIIKSKFEDSNLLKIIKRLI
jgi:two-component system chemotaxis sensor kinase CheA